MGGGDIYIPLSLIRVAGRYGTHMQKYTPPKMHQMYQNASKYIKMHQNASKCVKMHQNASKLLDIKPLIKKPSHIHKKGKPLIKKASYIHKKASRS